MTTRLELRSALRRRLEDMDASPLWDDATLNECLTGAAHRYGTHVPREVTTTVEVAAGATSVPVAAPTIEERRIVRVLDDVGVHVPRGRDAPGDVPPGVGMAATGQAWRWWGGTLLLQRPAARTGSWRIEHLDSRDLPADDTTPADLLPGDEEIVVALAAATALRRRVVEDAKRGSAGSTIGKAADAADRDAERLLAQRRRRIRGGWLASG